MPQASAWLGLALIFLAPGSGPRTQKVFSTCLWKELWALQGQGNSVSVLWTPSSQGLVQWLIPRGVLKMLCWVKKNWIDPNNSKFNSCHVTKFSILSFTVDFGGLIWSPSHWAPDLGVGHYDPFPPLDIPHGRHAVPKWPVRRLSKQGIVHINLGLLLAHLLNPWLSNMSNPGLYKIILDILIQLYIYMLLDMIKSFIKCLVELHKMHCLLQFYPNALTFSSF